MKFGRKVEQIQAPCKNLLNIVFDTNLQGCLKSIEKPVFNLHCSWVKFGTAAEGFGRMVEELVVVVVVGVGVVGVVGVAGVVGVEARFLGAGGCRSSRHSWRSGRGRSSSSSSSSSR